MKEKRNWPALITAFEGSGLSQTRFCDKHGVTVASFKNHLYRSRKDAAAKGGFSQLSVSAPPASPAVELHLPDGCLVRFADGVAASYLCELVNGLRP